jgi:hypothetical protein
MGTRPGFSSPESRGPSKRVRDDPTVYVGGPGRLREHDISHVGSPIWSMLRLLPLNAIVE